MSNKVYEKGTPLATAVVLPNGKKESYELEYVGGSTMSQTALRTWEKFLSAYPKNRMPVGIDNGVDGMIGTDDADRREPVCKFRKVSESGLTAPAFIHSSMMAFGLDVEQYGKNLIIRMQSPYLFNRFEGEKAIYVTSDTYDVAIYSIDGGQVLLNLTNIFKILGIESFDELPKEMRPRAYKADKRNYMKPLNFVHWWANLWDGTDTPDEQDVKEFVNGTSLKQMYVYRAKTKLMQLALNVYEWSRTTSCMHDFRFCGKNYGACDVKYRDFKYYENGRWLHPFRAYENGENYIYLVSKYNPQELDRRIVKAPFIGRAFGTETQRTRAYGDEKTDQILSGVGYYEKSAYYIDWTLRMYESEDGENVLPYLDNGNVPVRTERYVSSLESELGIGYIIVRPCDESEADWRGSADGEAERIERQYTCEVTGDEWHEEDVTYCEDVGGYVESRFARWDGNEYVLDGLEILRYFR